MGVGVKAIHKITGQVIPLGIFDTMYEAEQAVKYDVEWDEDDIPEDWTFIFEEIEDLM